MRPLEQTATVQGATIAGGEYVLSDKGIVWRGQRIACMPALVLQQAIEDIQLEVHGDIPIGELLDGMINEGEIDIEYCELCEAYVTQDQTWDMQRELDAEARHRREECTYN